MARGCKEGRSACGTAALQSTTTIKQLILPVKLANRFIPYVPKPMNEKYSSKPLCKNVPKQPSTVDSS